MSDLYKFLVDGTSITWFEQEDDGSFERKSLKLNQTLSFDSATGDVTLRSVFDTHVRIQQFHQTPLTTDDASFYGEPVTSFTAPDGTPIVPGSGGGHGGGGGGSDDTIPELEQHGGRHDLDGDHLDDDRVLGTSGRDIKRGGFGDDHMQGASGDDLLNGEDGDDDLSGDDGNDKVSGGSGFDLVHGGGGNDNVSGGDDDDLVNGDDGDDKISGGNGSDDLSGGNGKDILTGGAGDDHGSGGSGNDTIKGELGDDSIGGDSGDDSIDGGAGDDVLQGGAGRDVMKGGLGVDHFVFVDGDFAGLTKETADRISDFSHAQGDVIDLSGVDANTALDGDQAFTFIGTGAFSHVAGELKLLAGRSSVLLTGDTNGDAIADFAIRIDTKVALVEGDFIL